MRSFPPIREDYRRFDTFAQQFKSREQAEAYIRERNKGDIEGTVTPNQRDLLNYSWGDTRFSVDRRGQLHKQATGKTRVGKKSYRPGQFVLFTQDERDPEFQRLTTAMIAEDKERERLRQKRISEARTRQK